jgi:hypothetical protein
MIPEGLPDSNIAYEIGRMASAIEALKDVFDDERTLRRFDSKRISEVSDKLDILEYRLETQIKQIMAIERQVMSNKVEIDTIKTDHGIYKKFATKLAGAVGVACTFLGMAFSGILWSLTHWSESVAMLRFLWPGRP